MLIEDKMGGIDLISYLMKMAMNDELSGQFLDG